MATVERLLVFKKKVVAHCVSIDSFNNAIFITGVIRAKINRSTCFRRDRIMITTHITLRYMILSVALGFSFFLSRQKNSSKFDVRREQYFSSS